MSRDAVEKNRKKTTIIGGVEMALGVVLFVLTLLGVLPGGALQLLLMVLLIGFGFYSAFYYKLFYEKALVKAVNKQYQKSPFPTVEITLDFYEDRCVERSDGGRMVTKFKNIVGVRTTPSLIMIMVEQKRCLLIPRSEIGDREQQVIDLLDRACDTYGKLREEL